MSLFVRVDDYPGTKPDEFSEHNLQNFKIFDHYMQKHSARYVLGVIPGYTMPVDLQWLAEQEHITVAMHGVVHDESSLDEFRGKRYGDIENALLNSKHRLESILGHRVLDYIPPHNTINGDTVLALSRLGFLRIYGGPETSEEMKSLIKLEGMEYIHSEPPLEYGRSDELLERGSVGHLLEKSPRVNTYLTLHWTWEWNIGLGHLDKYLSKIDSLFK